MIPKQRGPKTVQDLIARTKEDSNGCWNWTMMTGAGGGYGMAGYKGRMHKASRLMMMFMGHKLTAKDWVCHKCDNKLCINPHHLYIGNPKTNAEDTKARCKSLKLGRNRTHCKNGHEFKTTEGFFNLKKAGRTYKIRYCKLCDSKRKSI